MKTRWFYAADCDLHPQYQAYWIVRFTSRSERDAWLDSQEDRTTRYAMPANHRAVRYAKRHAAFYDTNRMVPALFI